MISNTALHCLVQVVNINGIVYYNNVWQAAWLVISHNLKNDWQVVSYATELL